LQKIHCRDDSEDEIMGDGRVNLGGINPTKPGEGVHQEYSNGAQHVHVSSDVTKTTYDNEIYELLNAVATSATVTSNIWISTRDLVDGLLHFETSAAQTGNITAYYSFDGISAINSETVKALSGGAAEQHALGFSDFDTGSDAAGFTRNIKMYPFVTFGLASGAGTGTITSLATVIRRG